MTENFRRKVEALIFDLDGTLIDSKQDLVLSVNATLRGAGRAELPTELVASYVGSGAPVLIRRALGGSPDPAELQRALDYFLAYYEEHKLDHTAAIPEFQKRSSGCGGAPWQC